MAAGYNNYLRLTIPTIPLDHRTGVAEVETGYTEEQAREEASRCLKCWINTVFDGNETKARRASFAAVAWMYARRIACNLCRIANSAFLKWINRQSPRMFEQIQSLSST